MQITMTVQATRDAFADVRATGRTIGFVPTMGALHEGHASLMRQARQANDVVAVSIFVNPTQFGPNEDLSRYPRPFENDVALCRREGVDLIYHPEPAVMYPPGFATYVEVHGLQEVLCGASRPSHFRGVSTVVLKLFNIVQPTVAYFGQKDAQQALLLRRMVRDLDVPIRVEVCPTVRETDGLALSSRNQYLDAEQRGRAVVLSRALTAIRTQIDAGERKTEPLLRRVTEMIAATPGARLDYAAAVDADTLKPSVEIHGSILFALAVFFGTTRLIDNLLIDEVTMGRHSVN